MKFNKELSRTLDMLQQKLETANYYRRKFIKRLITLLEKYIPE